MIKKVFLFGIICWSAYVVWELAFWPDLAPSNEGDLSLDLNHGPFTVTVYPPKRSRPLAIIIFGSGDSGWRRLEQAIGRGCQEAGYELIGIDSAKYADTDYDLTTLQADFTAIAQNAREPFGKNPPPLIVGGYSMGAAQSIAVAGGPHPPDGLVGIVVVDMLSRGRYGLRTADQLNVLPTGPGTFGVTDFSANLSHLRLVQWHAEDDSIDSLAWLDTLPAPHQEHTFPDDGHSYQNNRPTFVHDLVQSISWILHPEDDQAVILKATPSHE